MPTAQENHSVRLDNPGAITSRYLEGLLALWYFSYRLCFISDTVANHCKLSVQLVFPIGKGYTESSMGTLR